jgi:hypothetical protein
MIYSGLFFIRLSHLHNLGMVLNRLTWVDLIYFCVIFLIIFCTNFIIQH